MIIKLNKWGQTLTGREFGKTILSQIKVPEGETVIFDFEGVRALGSSVADEVLAPIAKKQNSILITINTNRVIDGCLLDTAEYHGLTLK